MVNVFSSITNTKVVVMFALKIGHKATITMSFDVIWSYLFNLKTVEQTVEFSNRMPLW